MKRRKWIQTVLSAPAMVALPAAAQTATQTNEFAKVETGSPEPVAERGRAFFTADEYKALVDLSRAVFPSVDGRPGAIEAEVPGFLDFLISQAPSPRQSLYRAGLADWATGRKNAEFLQVAKDDILRATFNSRAWNEREGARRGGGSGTYYLAME